jgi:hypothetical protein
MFELKSLAAFIWYSILTCEISPFLAAYSKFNLISVSKKDTQLLLSKSCHVYIDSPG